MWSFGVPNVPCGVESLEDVPETLKEFTVPNVPCGVESNMKDEDEFIGHPEFLMYRVELKDIRTEPSKPTTSVPNVPCGVERTVIFVLLLLGLEFLMYRVELKAPWAVFTNSITSCS